MTKTGGRHRHRPGVVAGHWNRAELGRALPGLQRHRAHHEVRHDGLLGAHRGRGQGLRSAALHREERCQEDGHLHPVRHRGVAVRRRGREAGCHAGASRRAWGCSSRRGSAGSRRSSASTRRCSTAVPARSRRFSSPRPSSTWPPARCRSGSARRGPIPPPARRAPPRRTPSATPTKSSGATPPT